MEAYPQQRGLIPAHLIPDVPSGGNETNETVCSVKSAMEIRGFPPLVSHDLSMFEWEAHQMVDPVSS